MRHNQKWSWRKQSAINFINCVIAALGCLAPFGAGAESGEEKARQPLSEFQTLSSSAYFFEAPGANLLVTPFREGLLVVDADFAENAPSVLEEVQNRTNSTVILLINTHYHGDHAGGNKVFALHGANIAAHQNTRSRLKLGLEINGEMVRAPAPKDSLPNITYKQEARLYDGDEEILLIHPGSAHTDGDTIVHLRTANIIHMGDLFFNGGYPFIDIDSGGDLEGYMAAQELALSLSNDETIIIPGHGPVANREDLAKTLAMLREASTLIRELYEAGMSEAEVIAADPLADLNPSWGSAFYPPNKFARMLYRLIAKTSPQ